MRYDKDEIKNNLRLNEIFDLLVDLGGEPEYRGEGCIISKTICHNPRGQGSRKLYYYDSTKLFHCYSGCLNASFDIFELVCKVFKLQKDWDWELVDAMEYIVSYFNLSDSAIFQEDRFPQVNENWELLKRYDKIKIVNPIRANEEEVLKEYDSSILKKFAYIRIIPWEQEGISDKVIKDNLIGYYPSTGQITIPHFDIDGRFIGLRGRFLSEEDAERFGKYRPIEINGIWYTHPLGLNLYNLNNSKENITRVKTAIVFESEKSCLQYASMFGEENDISVACCGSSISNQQMSLLFNLGVREVIVAFDRQFQSIGDSEFNILKNKLINVRKKFGYKTKVTVMFDKDMITPYKSSPTDNGKEIFSKLLKERFEPV